MRIQLKYSYYFCRLKEKEVRRITSEPKPSLTDANNRAHVEYCLRHLEPCSMHDDPNFRADMDVVHIDEKWFYHTRKTWNMYQSHGKEAPHRECKHKNHIQKIMFLSAMARPRYDAQGNYVFMARSAFGLIWSGFKLRREVKIGWYLFMLLISAKFIHPHLY